MLGTVSNRQGWSPAELDIISSYFRTNTALPTIYKRLLRINPSRSYDSLSSKVGRMRRSGFSRPNEDMFRRLRVGYLDIECTSLNADFGYIICWCIKPAGKSEIQHAEITRGEVLDYTMDHRIVLELLTEMESYDALYVHWGADWRFDVPFIRSRAYAWGIEQFLPESGRVFIFDTWPISRKKLKLHSNRLDSIADILGVKTKKTPLSGTIWRFAALGHPDAVASVLHHNFNDVRILEAVHKKLARVERIGWQSI